MKTGALYFLAGVGAATLLWHGYMRGWGPTFGTWEKLIGRSK